MPQLPENTRAGLPFLSPLRHRNAPGRRPSRCSPPPSDRSRPMSTPMERPLRLRNRMRRYRDLTIAYEGHAEEIPIRVPDLSSTGMFINTTRSYPEGSVLKVRFVLERTGLEVQARTEVRYCLPGVGVGIEFVDISPESRSAIEKELND